ncbi:MAG TPA: ABC transporter permease [Candidatus Sulfotelmatobacter sp.]|nr:ABC transporter permease [Candidatus Sulfotelmatobacter sp.]
MPWWKNPFRGPRKDEDFDRELAFHIDELTQANVAKGMKPAEARRQAILEFGGREQVRQQLREVHSSRLLTALGFNLKSAWRFARRSPSFSIAIVLILAFAIGANSAVFSAMDAVVLRPLPFPDADELMLLGQHDVKNRDANRFVAPVRLEDWNRMNSTFQSISGYYMDDLSETSGPLPEKLTEAMVAPRFLRVMAVSPILGRNFTPEEERWGGPSVVLISYRYWQRRFHGDVNALNQKVRFQEFSSSIIGVMPASFAFPNRDVDVWSPSAPDAPFAQRRDSTWFTVIGRLKPGLTLALASSDLATVQTQLGTQFPKTDHDLIVQTTPLKETVVSAVRDSMWLLYGSVSLLLLIACSNIAALLLARTADREHEISVRFSLGASRSAIVTQILAEVLALATVGSLLGLLVAAGAVRAFHLLSNQLPRAEEITLNWRIVAYSLACAVGTTILCGLVPALRGTRRQLAHSLAQTSRTQVSRQSLLQWPLVAVQITLAVTLLTGAGLLLRSLNELSHVSAGFEPSHVLAFQITGSWGETAEMKTLVQRIDRTLDGLRSLPGVDAAATSGMLPGVPALYQFEFKVDGRLDPNRKVLADSRYVSAGYFQTMQIPVLVGETCKQGAGSNDVVVNRSFADRYLSGTPPIGHQLQGASYNDFQPQGAVRGVVADAREEGLNTQPVPTVYSCFTAPNPFPNYLVRTRGNPAEMAEAIRRRVHELEPSRSVYGITPLQAHLDEVSFENRLRTFLLVLFAASAVFLACIGIYGTLNYLGRLRQREVGMRLALGALPRQIVTRFVMQGLRVTGIGCTAGLVLSLIATRLIDSMLYGVSALDPATYGSVLLLILVVATAASLIPAWRASRIELVQVLREE